MSDRQQKRARPSTDRWDSHVTQVIQGSTAEETSSGRTEQPMAESMAQLFECPVCLDYITPPIRQCPNGHLICNTCRARIAKTFTCPVCRCLLPGYDIRALHMEKVAEVIGPQFTCPHTGCAARVCLSELAAHKNQCAHRPPAPLPAVEPMQAKGVADGADQSWRQNQLFRTCVLNKINEAIDRYGNAFNKPVPEVEHHILAKARTKEEYLSFVARLILHVKEVGQQSAPAVTPAAQQLTTGHTVQTN